MPLAGALVLAGGAGSRMSGGKAERPFNGAPLADHTAGRLMSAVPWLRLVTAPDAPALATRSIPDRAAHRGPLAALAHALPLVPG